MKDSDKSGWKDFIDLCKHVKGDPLFEEVLDFFFTLEEKQHLSTRIMLVRELLKAEKTQRQISKDLNVSIAKITRGSNALKQISKQLKLYLQKKLL